MGAATHNVVEFSAARPPARSSAAIPRTPMNAVWDRSTISARGAALISCSSTRSRYAADPVASSPPTRTTGTPASDLTDTAVAHDVCAAEVTAPRAACFATANPASAGS